MTDARNEAADLRAAAAGLHVPVLRDEAAAAALDGPRDLLVDATFGAGGYATALLDAGAAQVRAFDRDPEAVARGRAWSDALYGGRLRIDEACFSALADHLRPGSVDAALFDVGVSSMQIDAAARGFSFMRDGPLDMRMGDDGPTAADLVATLDEGPLADLIFRYGEDRRSRAIARAIVRARRDASIETTAQLADVVASAVPPARPGEPHPATRTFQALRIEVNDELGELARGLEAAETILRPGGRLVVVTFHSLEDRLAKRFLQDRCGAAPGGSRHQPPVNRAAPTFAKRRETKGVAPTEAEIAANPRARSARLRAAVRTEAPPRPLDAETLARLGAAPTRR